MATPHQPHHPQYGSFASNSPLTDGKHLFAFFGSRGLYCYTLAGELVWQKDFGALRMYNNFGEGAWTALDGDKLVVVLDQEGESFLACARQDHRTRTVAHAAPGQHQLVGPVHHRRTTAANR